MPWVFAICKSRGVNILESVHHFLVLISWPFRSHSPWYRYILIQLLANCQLLNLRSNNSDQVRLLTINTVRWKQLMWIEESELAKLTQLASFYKSQLIRNFNIMPDSVAKTLHCNRSSGLIQGNSICKFHAMTLDWVFISCENETWETKMVANTQFAYGNCLAIRPQNFLRSGSNDSVSRAASVDSRPATLCNAIARSKVCMF